MSTVARRKADLERLAVVLGASGNYAFTTRGAMIYAAFELDSDATRFTAILRPEQTTRDAEWASKNVARINAVSMRRISALLNKGRARKE